MAQEYRTKLTLEDIASVCHEANQALSKVIGFPVLEGWDYLSSEAKADTVKGVEYAINNSNVTDQEMHKSWCDAKTLAGWVYGEDLDRENKIHPCLVKYEHLPPVVQAKDAIFRNIVLSLGNILETDKERAIRLADEATIPEVATSNSKVAGSLEAASKAMKTAAKNLLKGGSK